MTAEVLNDDQLPERVTAVKKAIASRRTNIPRIPNKQCDLKFPIVTARLKGGSGKHVIA